MTHKSRLGLLALMLTLSANAIAQNVGDFILPEKTATTGRVTNRTWPKGAGKLWGTNASSLPQSITIGSGLTLTGSTLTASGSGGSGAWADITGTPTTLIGYGITDAITAATAATTYQPLDSDLTSIAALTTTTHGRSLLTSADASATRTALGLGTLATQSATITDYLTTATAASTYQPKDLDLTRLAWLDTTDTTGGTFIMTSGVYLRLKKGDDSEPYTGGAGGSINMLGQSATFDSSGGSAGNINMSGGGEFSGGSLTLSSNGLNNAGSLDTTAGGSLTMGTANLAGGDVTGTILTTDGSAANLTDFPTLNQNTSGYASALKSATTTVSISSATAPTTGQVLTATGASAATWQTPSGGLTNLTEILLTSSPNNTVNALQLAVTDGTTNDDLVLTPKGTGALILGPPPDGTSTGGNKRGSRAVDLQLHTESAGGVASGDDSFAAGFHCGATASSSIAMGRNSFATNVYAVAIGYGNSSAGEFALALGTNNSASGNFSSTTGYQATADRYGVAARASGAFASAGDAQSVAFCARLVTTNDTPTGLFLNGSSTLLTIPSGKALHATVKIIGIKSDGTSTAVYMRQVAIKNAGGTTALVGSINTIGGDTAAGTSISITADDTNDALAIAVTGITAETWRWVATIDGVEVAYGS